MRSASDWHPLRLYGTGAVSVRVEHTNNIDVAIGSWGARSQQTSSMQLWHWSSLALRHVQTQRVPMLLLSTTMEFKRELGVTSRFKP